VRSGVPVLIEGVPPVVSGPGQQLWARGCQHGGFAPTTHVDLGQ
jgi:hypothetical protein